jgi:hypothetical protein
MMVLYSCFIIPCQQFIIINFTSVKSIFSVVTLQFLHTCVVLLNQLTFPSPLFFPNFFTFNQGVCC